MPLLNDLVDVTIAAAEAAIRTDDWRLGYALAVHSSQGLTIYDPQKVWIIDDYTQWSNLVYLAVSRVEYMHQLERVACPPEQRTEDVIDLTAQYRPVRETIQRKLVAYKHQDRVKRLPGCDSKVDYILQLRKDQRNRCAACNVYMLWAYQPKDTQQFCVDRLDNSKGHSIGNVRLSCLECNKKRGVAALIGE